MAFIRACSAKMRKSSHYYNPALIANYEKKDLLARFLYLSVHVGRTLEKAFS